MSNSALICLLFLVGLFQNINSQILCEVGFCVTYVAEEGCPGVHQHCSANNATHTGIWLSSPTMCNCCPYCMPFYLKDENCSLGGPGTGTTIGRCGDGLTCDQERNVCIRMESECHSAQDTYDEKHANGETGALENRPLCDGKGKYDVFACIPTQTCFCQTEKGERLFGEVLYMGIETRQNMHCVCSRLHEKIKNSISAGVRLPVIGPRCTSEGNFNPVQCIDRTCYCVDPITGVIIDGEEIDLDEEPWSELSCYDPEVDLFPEQMEDGPPYNYTTPCYKDMEEKIQIILQSEEDGYNVDYFSEIPECLPDGTYGRIARTRNGTRICVDDRGQQIENYEVMPHTPEYEAMDCKCAQTSLLMAESNEKPICCKNGNFRKIQCRRGRCRCVDSDGRQIEQESNDVTSLSCYTEDWRDC